MSRQKIHSHCCTPHINLFKQCFCYVVVTSRWQATPMNQSQPLKLLNSVRLFVSACVYLYWCFISTLFVHRSEEGCLLAQMRRQQYRERLAIGGTRGQGERNGGG